MLWEVSDPASAVDIEYTTDGSTWNSLAMGRINDGHAPVTVPTTPSTTAQVRVTEKASGEFDVSDDVFTFAGLAVTSPNGGETWFAGGPGTVTWVSGGVSGTVDIEITPDGVTWAPLATGTANDGSEAIVVPYTLSTSARVRVTETGGVADQSDAFFEIAGIAVTSPNGGEIWRFSAPGDITWLAGFPGTVDIELTTDGVTWIPIALASPNDGTETIAVPATPTATARIRVSETAGTLTDASDADFSIQPLWELVASGLPAVRLGDLAWGDYDGDGDLDLALCGLETGGPGPGITRIYRNDAGSFVDIGAPIVNVGGASLDWGDYDDDGDLDLAIMGDPVGSSVSATTRIYRNDGGAFVFIPAPLTGVFVGDIEWGDYDNDGDLDLALAGVTSGGTAVSLLYRNDSGAFTDTAAGFTGVTACSLAWGDYDGDGDLDLVLSGFDGAALVVRLYRNNLGAPDAAPAAPGSPVATPGAGTVALTWTAPTDDNTPAAGLSYNLRIGTTPGSSNRYASMANAATGIRRVPARGQIQGTSKSLSLPSGTYYWSVQAVDTSFAGGTWATEGSFTIP